MILRRSESEKDQQVDPRVKVELERLNSATDEINKLEVELDQLIDLWLVVEQGVNVVTRESGHWLFSQLWSSSDILDKMHQREPEVQEAKGCSDKDLESRASFHKMLRQSMVETESLCTRLGPTIVEKARPYYAARIQAKQAHSEAQRAAVRLEKANSAHSAAKEMVFLAEEGLTMEGRTFDHAWQEMLNHATIRVNECEAERTQSEAHHQRATAAYQVAQNKVTQLQKELKKVIAKSRPYYEVKANLNGLLDGQKARIVHLENRVLSAKATYANALKNLESISNEIHKSRKGIHRHSNKARADSPDATSSTTSSASTGSPDSFPHDDYLRLPERPDASPVTPQCDYNKLASGSEEVSPIDPCRAQLSPSDPPSFASSSNLQASNIPNATNSQTEEEEWSEIPLSAEEARVSELEEVKNSENPNPSTFEQIGRRQSIDALLSSTGKVKEMFSQGIMKLNIGSISERRGSLESCRRRVGSLQRPSSSSSRYSTDEGASSNEDPLSSDEMLSDEQIASLMLDEELRSGSALAAKPK